MPFIGRTLKIQKTVNITKKKQIYGEREQTSDYQQGERRGKRQHRGRRLRGTNSDI